MTDFEKIYSFESLYNAYRKARQGKRWKGAAAKFEVNLLEALNLLSAQIRTKSYTMHICRSAGSRLKRSYKCAGFR